MVPKTSLSGSAFSGRIGPGRSLGSEIGALCELHLDGLDAGKTPIVSCRPAAFETTVDDSGETRC